MEKDCRLDLMRLDLPHEIPHLDRRSHPWPRIVSTNRHAAPLRANGAGGKRRPRRAMSVVRVSHVRCNVPVFKTGRRERGRCTSGSALRQTCWTNQGTVLFEPQGGLIWQSPVNLWPAPSGPQHAPVDGPSGVIRHASNPSCSG